MIARLPDLESVQPVVTAALSDDDVATTLEDVGAFLDDPLALLERAVELLRRKRNEVATYLLFGAVAAHLWGRDLLDSVAAFAS